MLAWCMCTAAALPCPPLKNPFFLSNQKNNPPWYMIAHFNVYMYVYMKKKLQLTMAKTTILNETKKTIFHF